MANWKAIGAKVAVGVTLFAAGIGVGRVGRVSYQELPPKAKDAIVLEHKALASSLQDVENLLKQGDFKGALAEFKKAEDTSKMMSKIDPEFTKLWKDLQAMDEFTSQLAQLAGLLEDYNRLSVRDLELVKSGKEIPFEIVSSFQVRADTFQGRFPHLQSAIRLLEDKPDLFKAMQGVILQVLEEWKASIASWLSELNKYGDQHSDKERIEQLRMFFERALEDIDRLEKVTRSNMK